MFALAEKRGRNSFAAAHAGVDGERVLPRFLRKPARFVSRLASGNVEVPRHAGAVSAFMFLLATGMYGTFVGGRTNEFLQVVTVQAGFAITDVQMAGQKQTSEVDVLTTLGLNGRTSLVGFDTAQARTLLTSLPWIKSAEITKMYPDGLAIKLEEREPFAIWQHDEELSLIEEDGTIIVPFAHQEYSNLPLITGVGAEREARLLVPAIAAIPELKSRVKAQMLVAGRRWDIRLDNGVTIQLPAGDPAAALKGLAALDSATGLLSKDIETVDLRVPGEMVVRLTETGKQAFDEVIAARDKAAKKAGKKS